TVDVFGDHGLGGLLKEGAHGKSPKCLSRNLGDFRGFCKGLGLCFVFFVCMDSVERLLEFFYKIKTLLKQGGG
ncbi:hypothetical protein, partial [Neisseria sp. P0018.S004]|uniref:hypothetical protein n=1 Tax=unclassified Neisseria TaxID=2623750 RepID=UPI003F80E23D